jgi:hypothetical protein
MATLQDLWRRNHHHWIVLRDLPVPQWYVFLRLSDIALAYLDSGKVKVEGIVNKTFTIDQWAECLESMRNKSAIKVLSMKVELTVGRYCL